MKRYYISHPFTGDEETNRMEAREITAELIIRYPDIDFINPLDAMMAHEMAELDYNAILARTIMLMKLCDGIILTGRWKESRGCKAELRAAQDFDLEIYRGAESFIMSMKGDR